MGKGQACKTSVLANDPKSVSTAQRVREFDGGQLTVSAGKLFCKACCEGLSR